MRLYNCFVVLWIDAIARFAPAFTHVINAGHVLTPNGTVHSVTSSRTVFIDKDISLANGTVRSFSATFIRPGMVAFQVWRPNPSDVKIYSLVGEKIFTASEKNKGKMTTVFLSKEETFWILAGDRLGFTSYPLLCPIHAVFVTDTKSKAVFHILEKRPSPSVGSSYLFDHLGFPYQFSVQITYDTEFLEKENLDTEGYSVIFNTGEDGVVRKGGGQSSRGETCKLGGSVARGPTGERGAQGPPGAKGDQGLPGPPGDDHQDESGCEQRKGIDRCQHLCQHDWSGHHCTCRDGYILSTDSKTCEDLDECTLNNGGCQSICKNTVGSFSCDCNTGRQLALDAKTCIDINECEDDGLHSAACGAGHTCLNTFGSFICLKTGNKPQAYVSSHEITSRLQSGTVMMGLIIWVICLTFINITLILYACTRKAKDKRERKFYKATGKKEESFADVDLRIFTPKTKKTSSPAQ